MTVLLAAVIAAALLVVRPPRARRRIRVRVRPDLDRRVAGLLRIGLAGGLPLAAALDVAAGELEGDERRELETVRLRIRHAGTAPALLATEGPLAGLFHRLAAAHAAGAPMAHTLAVHAAESRVRERARLLRRTRTLPVRLVVPLALLLLPGFTALVVGPSVLEQIRSLAGVVP